MAVRIVPWDEPLRSPVEAVFGPPDPWTVAQARLAILVQRVARASVDALAAPGVNVLHVSGSGSRQSVGHLHLHVIPRWPDDGLDRWVRGTSTRTVASERRDGFNDVPRTRILPQLR